MKTKTLRPRELSEAAAIIKRGGIVAVPTETVYGLACNGLDSTAVGRIYKVKGRPELKPLSLLVSGAEDIGRYAVEAPGAAKKLADRFWPGPLTMVFKAGDKIAPNALAGGETAGLRCPAHFLTLELLKSISIPLAAPSANPSGAASPKTVDEVLRYFDGKIDAVLDGGDAELGRESTVMDLTSKPFRTLREGFLPTREIFGFLRDSMKIIGITGPTGSGKSTALEILRSMGALAIDCDLLYHRLLTDNGSMTAEIISRFPKAAGKEGVDRKALGELVFSDTEALLELNSITHKYVYNEREKRLYEWACEGGALAAVDAVALIESGASRCCDTVVGVLAPKEKRIERIIAREGIGKEYARARADSQKDDSFYIQNCDHILYNSGSVEDFLLSCKEFFERKIKES